MFEKYQKAARAGPDKKEREEIEMLKSQVSLPLSVDTSCLIKCLHKAVDIALDFVLGFPG